MDLPLDGSVSTDDKALTKERSGLDDGHRGLEGHRLREHHDLDSLGSHSEIDPGDSHSGRSDRLEAMDYLGPKGRGRGRRGGGWLWVILLLALPIGALGGYFSSLGPPVAMVSSELLEFGEMRLGEVSSERVVGVSNQGERKLWLTATVLSGEAAGDFRLVADECAGLEIAVGATCEVRLTLSPTGRGIRRALLRFDSNAANGSPTVFLRGMGIAPELVIEPPVLDLGRQVVGSAGASKDLRLDNRGTAPLRLGRVELSGAGAADFLRVADTCSSQSLDPGEHCAIRFTFVPRAAGERQALIRIANDAETAPASATLLAFASRLEPLLQISPDDLDFSFQDVGGLSQEEPLEVFNAGNISVRLRRIRINEGSVAGSESAFELVSETCLGKEIPTGDRCILKIRFRPSGAGPVSAFLDLESTASPEPYRVLLQGSGAIPQSRLEPSKLSFGSVGVGSTSGERNLRLMSTGTTILKVGDLTVRGSDAASFAASGCTGTSLEPSRGCEIEVWFRPRRAGPHRADLVIRHNAGSQRQVVPLNGVGVTARLSVEPRRIVFDGVRVGREQRRRLEIQNSGRASLMLRRLRLTAGRGSGFDLVTDRCTGATLAPLATCSVEVRFQPSSAGSRSLRLTIEHDASSQSIEVPIEGTATATK